MIMNWLSGIARPVKYSIVLGGIAFSSALIYQYFTQRKKAIPLDDVIKDTTSSSSVPEIIINETSSPEIENLSESYVCLPNNTHEEIAAKEPIEDESFAEDDDTPLKPTRKVLMLGLEKSGKSSLLSQLSREGTDCVEYEPTKGFNVVCISFDDVDLSIWEIGGNVEYRTYWKNFCSSTNLIFFIVDATNRSNLNEVKEFFNTVYEDCDSDIGFYIAATKTDHIDAMSVEEIRTALGIRDIELDILKVSVEAGGAKETVGLDQLQEYCLYK